MMPRTNTCRMQIPRSDNSHQILFRGRNRQPTATEATRAPDRNFCIYQGEFKG